MPVPASDFLVRYERLPEDEREVLCEVLRGLEVGLEQYGALNIDVDRRDWLRETLDEARDGLVYTALAVIKARRSRG